MITTPSGPLTRPAVWLVQVCVQHNIIITTNHSLSPPTMHLEHVACMPLSILLLSLNPSHVPS